MHKDVKPLNMVFDRDGYLRLIDFGISKEIKPEDNGSLQGDGMGTPGYMAPEVSDNQKYDYSADVFSLGMTAL